MPKGKKAKPLTGVDNQFRTSYPEQKTTATQNLKNDWKNEKTTIQNRDKRSSPKSI